MKRIAALTSGGDAPGMNGAVRSIVRTGIQLGWEVLGVRQGYAGLIAGEVAPLGMRDVGGILQRGGTILGSARSPEFETESGQRRALDQLTAHGIEALVVIGGNGSQTGAAALARAGFPVVGVASTIDNDLVGSDITIGVDSALNVALEAIDRLKTTASSLSRVFLVEVMGRDCGYLALMAGLAGGAEAVVIPEVETDPEAVIATVREGYRRGKRHALVVIAEGATYKSQPVTAYFQENQERLGFELRITVLGHVQRGGAPGAFDRILSTRLGAGATAALAHGEHGVLVGWVDGGVASVPLADIVGKRKGLDQRVIDLARTLAEEADFA